MKTILTLLFAGGVILLAAGCATTPHGKGYKTSYSSFDQPGEHPPETAMPSGSISFQGVELNTVLKIYESISGRTVVRGSLPGVRIVLHSATPLTRVQILQLFDSVLAQNGIAMVLAGDRMVKAVPADQANRESPPEITRPWRELPESGSCMSRTVHLKKLRAVEVMPLLSPLAKLPNSLFAIQAQNILILRDYSANIRQQLQLLEKLEQDAGK